MCKSDTKIVHTINKDFDPFGGFVKNIIFSIYIKNTDKKLSKKHDNTRKQLDRHLVRLINNHKDYAKKCNADYKVFVDDEKWLEFKEKYEQYQFDTINLYKIYVLEKLG